MQSNIFSTIRSEINDFKDNSIYPVEGYSFNQYDTIKRVHLYENSHFASGVNGGSTSDPLSNFKDEQDDRIFYNISNPRRDAVKSFLDVDIKDVTIEEINPESERPIMLLNEDFRRFANKVNLSHTFNQLNHDRTTYGSTVIKINGKNKPTVVDLRRLFLDPTVDTITDSRFVTLKHIMTPSELRKKKDIGWDADAIERIIKSVSEKSQAQESYENDGNVNQIISSKYIEVYERYGYVEDGSKEKFMLSIVAEPFNVETKTTETGKYTLEGGAILYDSEWKKDLPFRDSHFMKTKGRWLGVGIFEMLFTAQERMNELANQKRTSMSISALHLFQTADPTVLNNILTDLENGDLIKTKTPNGITSIANEERNLPAYNLEEASYKELGDSLTFANDLVTGGDIPSSTPATNVVVQNNNMLSVHLNNREEFCNFIGEYIKDFVIPQLIKDVSAEHYISIASDSEDLLGIDETIVDLKIIEKFKSGDIPVEMMVDPDGYRQEIMNELKKSGSKRFVKIYQDYYKEKIDDVFVHVDNEKKDMAKIANNTYAFYQLVASNPEGLTNPVTKLLLTSYARDIGVDTSKLDVAFAKAEAKQQVVEQEQKAQKVPKVEAQSEKDTREAKVQ